MMEYIIASFAFDYHFSSTYILTCQVSGLSIVWKGKFKLNQYHFNRTWRRLKKKTKNIWLGGTEQYEYEPHEYFTNLP